MPNGEALILHIWYTCKPFCRIFFYLSFLTASTFDVDMFICGNFVRRETPLNRGFFGRNTIARTHEKRISPHRIAIHRRNVIPYVAKRIVTHRRIATPHGDKTNNHVVFPHRITTLTLTAPTIKISTKPTEPCLNTTVYVHKHICQHIKNSTRNDLLPRKNSHDNSKNNAYVGISRRNRTITIIKTYNKTRLFFSLLPHIARAETS